MFINKLMKTAKHKNIDLNKSNDYASGRGIIMKDNKILPYKIDKNSIADKTPKDSQKIKLSKGSDNLNDNLSKNAKNNQENLNKQSQLANLNSNNPNKKPAKALHLNHVEKEMFFTALAIGNAFNNSTRSHKLISVESLYGIFYFIKKLSYPLIIRLKKMMKISIKTS